MDHPLYPFFRVVLLGIGWDSVNLYVLVHWKNQHLLFSRDIKMSFAKSNTNAK